MYSTELLLNAAKIREVGSERNTGLYAPLPCQVTNDLTNSDNIKILRQLNLVTFFAI